MKKGFKSYIAAWIIILIVFNIICFATPARVGEYFKYDAAFWTAYVFMTLAFIGQLICASVAFSADNAKKLFYNMPLITISYTGLVLMLIAGAITIAIPNLPFWIGIILCVIILGFTVVAVIKADAVAKIVQNVDDKENAQTSFIKNMTLEAETLMAQAKTPEIKTACKKVYEVLRYSDPISSPELSVIEAKITVKMEEFSSAVIDQNNEKADSLSEELKILVNGRNRRCRAAK